METMGISLTIFDSIYDNQTVKRMDYDSFDEFESVLYRLAEGKKYEKKTDAPLISPAVYKPETTRSNESVSAWAGFGIIDVDNFVGDIKDIEEMEQLGIIECDEEDFALCSFACPSKIDVGGMIRDGLDLMEEEG